MKRPTIVVQKGDGAISVFADIPVNVIVADYDFALICDDSETEIDPEGDRFFVDFADIVGYDNCPLADFWYKFFKQES